MQDEPTLDCGFKMGIRILIIGGARSKQSSPGRLIKKCSEVFRIELKCSSLKRGQKIHVPVTIVNFDRLPLPSTGEVSGAHHDCVKLNSAI